MYNTVFSIIVPCYNQAKWVSFTLESILIQSNSDWECIIVDDGSTDNTEAVISKYICMDRRFSYVYKKNGGLSSARNYGLRKAVGEFILFLDSDDLISPNKLEMTFNAFLGTNLDVVYTNFQFCCGDQIDLVFNPFLNVELNACPLRSIVKYWDSFLSIPIHCMAFRHTFLIQNNLFFDENLPAKEDWDFHIQVALLTDRYKYIDSVGCVYRLNDGSMSKNISKMLIGNYRVLNRYYHEQKSYIAFNLANCIAMYLFGFLKNRHPTIIDAFKIYKQEKLNTLLLLHSLFFLPAILILRFFLYYKKKKINDG